MILITREEAKARGAVRYYTGKPCKHGHDAERFVSSRSCVECTREAVKARMRSRRKNHDYLQSQKDYQREYARKRYREDPEFRDKQLERKRNRREDPEHREQRREYMREYVKNNRAKFAAKNAKRHAAKIQRTPAWADLDMIAVFYATAREMTEETGVPHEVDHVVPMQGKNVSGLHVATNLQILSASENRSKRNKYGGI